MQAKKLMAAALAAVLMCAVHAAAKSSSHKSSEKSVYVHSYTRKDGTEVTAHYRRPPSASTSTHSPVRYKAGTVANGYTVHPTVARNSHGRIKRSQTAKNAFKRQQPCPSTGNSSGGCRGYVIDHIQPLECGGADDPSNMQWQTIAEGKAKDKTERYCRN